MSKSEQTVVWETRPWIGMDVDKEEFAAALKNRMAHVAASKTARRIQ